MKSLSDVLGVPDPKQPTSESKPVKITVKTLAKGILNSPQYLESIRRRILADTLPPAVECKLYEYAFGKPVDKVEFKDTTNDLGELSTEELEAKAIRLAELARKLRGEESGATEDVAPGSVH